MCALCGIEIVVEDSCSYCRNRVEKQLKELSEKSERKKNEVCDQTCRKFQSDDHLSLSRLWRYRLPLKAYSNNRTKRIFPIDL